MQLNGDIMCKYCQRKPILNGIFGFDREENSSNITDGRWNSIRAGVNYEGHFIMFASGDSDGKTDNFMPEWCPFCGRHLYEINKDGEQIFYD